MLKITFLFLLAMSIAIINIGCEEDATEAAGEDPAAEKKENGEQQETPLSLTDAINKLPYIAATSKAADITAISTALAKITKTDDTLDEAAITGWTKESLKKALDIYGDGGDKAISKLETTATGDTKTELGKLKNEVNKILGLLDAAIEEGKTTVPSPLTLSDALTNLAKIKVDSAPADITAISTALAKLTKADGTLDENEITGGETKQTLKTKLDPYRDDGDKAIYKLETAAAGSDRKNALRALKNEVNKILGLLDAAIEEAKDDLTVDAKTNLDTLEDLTKALTTASSTTITPAEINTIHTALSVVFVDNLKETAKERLKEVLNPYTNTDGQLLRGIKQEAVRILQPIKIDALETQLGELEKLTETTPTSDITAITKALKDIDINKAFLDELDDKTKEEFKRRLTPYGSTLSGSTTTTKIDGWISTLDTQIDDATTAEDAKPALKDKNAALKDLRTLVDPILVQLRRP